MPMKSGTGDDPYSDTAGEQSDERTGGSQRLQDAVADALASIEAGDLPDQMSARHEGYKALLVAFEERGELERVAKALAEDLGVDVSDVNRGRVMALAIGLGLETAVPETVEALREAQAEVARRDL